MLKNISNLGKTLNKAEQKSINGGFARCTPYHCWLRFTGGNPIVPVEQFICNGHSCELTAF